MRFFITFLLIRRVLAEFKVPLGNHLKIELLDRKNGVDTPITNFDSINVILLPLVDRLILIFFSVFL